MYKKFCLRRIDFHLDQGASVRKTAFGGCKR